MVRGVRCAGSSHYPFAWPGTRTRLRAGREAWLSTPACHCLLSSPATLLACLSPDEGVIVRAVRLRSAKARGPAPSRPPSGPDAPPVKSIAPIAACGRSASLISPPVCQWLPTPHSSSARTANGSAIWHAACVYRSPSCIARQASRKKPHPVQSARRPRRLRSRPCGAGNAAPHAGTALGR